MSLGRSLDPDDEEEERRHWWPRFLLFGLLAVVVLGAAVTGGGAWWLRHAMRVSLPQLDGRMTLAGLKAPVTVRRDEHGDPHIQAANLDDLLFAQGFVTAQDRLWELDMSRRAADGDLAAILGSKLVEHDREQRVLAIRQTAERLTAGLDDQDRRYFQDYARGVNAYIASHQDRLPAEFRLLMYKPQPWEPEDSMAVALGMVQLLDDQWPEKVERERITARLGPTLAADLYPTNTWRDHPVISGEPPITAPGQVIPDVPLDPSQTGGTAREQGSGSGEQEARSFPLLARVAAGWLSPPVVSGPGGHDPWSEVVDGGDPGCLGCDSGSNEWVVAGSKTATGHAMLSNDMHLPHRIPNTWYEIDMEAPGFHAAGLSVPGIPFVIAGHNEHIAWGFTALFGDTQDVYVEKTNTQGDCLGTDGAWHPMEHDVETIAVRGGRNVTVEVERTGHGVVITPLIPGEKRTLALEWTIYSSAAHGFPLLALDTASNWTEFRQALSQWWAPTQNVVYADDQGNIGYQAVGLIPLRPGGLQGVPISETGSGSGHEWQGFIPFEQMPTSYNPPDGLLATANSRVTPNPAPEQNGAGMGAGVGAGTETAIGATAAPDAGAGASPGTGAIPGAIPGPGANPPPNEPITLEWGEPYRNERIWKWLGPKKDLTQQNMLTLQTDVYSEVDKEIAQRLAYGIDHSDDAGPELKQAANLMRTWNGVVGIDSAPAAIVAAAKEEFYPMLLRPKLGAEWRYYRWGESIYAAEQILMNESPAWLPGKYRDWNDFLADVVRQGLKHDHAPKDLGGWRYGYAHPVDVEHPIFGLIPWFKGWTGTGPWPQSGDTTTVKQVARTFGPSQRFTINWGDVDGATENIFTGESGDPLSPYYHDQWPYWYAGKTFALPFSDQAVAAATAHTLKLEP